MKVTPLLIGLVTSIVANLGAQTNVRDLNDTERKNIERATGLIEEVGKDLSKMADDCEKMLKEAESKRKVPKDVDPAKLREQLKHVHEEEDGWKAMADNIRQLLKDGKIKSGTLTNEKAITDAGKQIVIDGRYLDTWEFDPDSEFSGLGKFQSLATLCEILVHEKTHYAITIKGEWLLERKFFVFLFGDNALEWRPYIAGIHFLASLHKYVKRADGKKKDEKLKVLQGLIDQALKTFSEAGGKTGKKFADELRELFKQLGILGMAAPRVPDQGADGSLLANVATENVVPQLGGAVTSGHEALPVLDQNGKVKVESVGTGETSGHIADIKIKNLTDRTVNCVVLPMVLESKSRKSQDYVCPKGQTVTIHPRATATIPLEGVCINRNRPPVSKGAPGDLIVNTGDPTIPQKPDSHIRANEARELLRTVTAIYDAVGILQRDGMLKDLPYKDRQKQRDIVVQWSTWCDPRISEITGVPPATKEDLRKVVYKQVEEQGPMSPERKKKVDQGIDTIFEKVELTTAKAKDLEKSGPFFEGPVTSETAGPIGTLSAAPTATPPTATPTPTPSVRRRDEEELREFIDQQMPGAARKPAPTAIPTATATATLAPNMRVLQDCLDAAKKKRDECKDDAEKRSGRCLDKCDKDYPNPASVNDQIQKQLCVLNCALKLLSEIGRCDANYAEALEDCIKKHLAEEKK